MKNKDKKDFSKIPAVKFVKKYSAYFYLGAAVVTVAIMSATVYSVSRGEDISIPEISVPSIQLPDVSEAPVANNPTGVPADVVTVPQYYAPVMGDILTPYAMTELVFSPTMQDYRTHNGVDISSPVGASVVSFTDGTIQKVYEDTFYGTVVVISHSDGVNTTYANLQQTLSEGIKEGMEVKAGQSIGKVGTTAIIEASTAPHLHFEVTKNGVSSSPEEYLKLVNN